MSSDSPDFSTLNPDTALLHSGTIRSAFGETSEALYLNSAYCYDSAEAAAARFDGSDPGFTYSRYSHPNLAMLQDRLCALEGAESCIVTASGMSAVFLSLMALLKTGDHVVAHRVMFSSCHYIITDILPRYGIEVTLVDGTEMQHFEDAITAKTRAVFIETPANPTLELVDITALARICKRHDTTLIVDNVFATPLLQKPLAMGADVVVYSTTKHMDGQGRTLGGAVLCSKALMEDRYTQYNRHTGPHMSPFTAWIVFKSLETFGLRMQRHVDNGEALAHFLAKHPKVAWVRYPFLTDHPQYALAKQQMQRGGALVTFGVKGGATAAFQVMNQLKLFTISNNLGDSRSLITHPTSSTHASIAREEREKIGLTDDLIRISAGLEATDDLIADMKEALDRI